MDDVILNKAQTIERYIRRVREEYAASQLDLETNYTHQDAIILNLQRACEASIDMGVRVIRLKKLPVPQTYKEIFKILLDAQIITDTMSINLQKMTGFRNIAVHEYTAINLVILRSIIENHLDDFLSFAETIVKMS